MFRLSRQLLLVVTLLIALFAVAWPAYADTTYVVQAGDTLYRIAQRFGVTVDAIRVRNGLTGNWIYSGQTLVIPSDAPTNAPPSAENPRHVVAPGETLFTIGLRYGLQWTTIARANNIVGDQVYVGQTLIIPINGQPASTPTPQATPSPETTIAPPATETPAPAPTAAPPATNTTHVVQAGETLFTIGLRYGLQWTTIARANNIVGDRVYTGQTLVIPAPSSTPVAPPTPAPAPPVGLEGRYFLVDISDQMLYAYEGNTLVRSTLISSGAWPYPTVIGTYYIYLRYTAQDMAGPGYYLPGVPYVMYFYKGYALHGTYWHSNFGTPMSHGCVNMPTAEAEWAFNWSGIGTPVVVQY